MYFGVPESDHSKKQSPLKLGLMHQSVGRRQHVSHETMFLYIKNNLVVVFRGGQGLVNTEFLRGTYLVRVKSNLMMCYVQHEGRN